MAALEEQHLLADRALGYVELYGAYTETEARYRVDRLMALWDRMDEDDRARRSASTPPRWTGTPTSGTSTSLGHRARPGADVAGQVRPAQPGRAGPQGHPLPRPPPGRLRPREHPHRLQRGRLLRLAGLPSSARRPNGRPSWPIWCAEAPSLLLLDRRDRGDFLRSFYRRYEGAPVDRLRDDGWELFHHLLLAKSFPAGIARVRAHRALGHRTILITGALDLVVEPLRPLFDDIVCARLGEADGKFTGRLDELPPIGEARALVLADYAEAEGLQLEESMAYADSASDLPMLEAVGFPVAVNPEAKLAAIARRRGWHVEHWHKADGGRPARPPPRPARPPGLARPRPHQPGGPGRGGPAAGVPEARR